MHTICTIKHTSTPCEDTATLLKQTATLVPVRHEQALILIPLLGASKASERGKEGKEQATSMHASSRSVDLTRLFTLEIAIIYKSRLHLHTSAFLIPVESQRGHCCPLLETAEGSPSDTPLHHSLGEDCVVRFQRVIINYNKTDATFVSLHLA